jgi:hypothetical protein
MKQNFFADMADFMSDDGFTVVAVLFGLSMLIGAWIYSGSFWGAAILAIMTAPTLGGLAALFIACASMMFSRREEDPDTKSARLANFLIPLPGVIMSGAFLYAAYLIAAA